MVGSDADPNLIQPVPPYYATDSILVTERDTRMYKMFIVGLGGSGGKTLQFLMDDLRVQLKAAGWQKNTLPAAWQFVHIDVPSASDGIDDDLPPVVPAQGGHYIGVAKKGDDYAGLDSALSYSLSNASSGSALAKLARWRPNPNDVKVSIEKGAGQFRAIGRIATLTRGGVIYQGLSNAITALQSTEANADFAELARLLEVDQQAPQGTLVLVVTSLAGGSGASMTLDVCNILRGLTNANFPGDSAASFLYTPDVFNGLTTPGARPNALGAISELMSAMAAGSQPWTDEEWSVYNTGGAKPAGRGRGPFSVFPVGATNATTGAKFGSGPHDVYRGFARILASLYLDDNQQNAFQAYSITNFQNLAFSTQDRSELTLDPYQMRAVGTRSLGHFGAMGYASIGMGRDRYAEYTAQRLARASVKQLIEGHYDTDVRSGRKTAIQARDEARDTFYPSFVSWVGLSDPIADPNFLPSLIFQVWQMRAQQDFGNSVANEVRNQVFSQPGLTGTTYATQLGVYVTRNSFSYQQRAEEQLKASASQWVLDIQNRIELAYLRLSAERGLAVAGAVLSRFKNDLATWSAHLESVVSHNTIQPTQIVQAASASIGSITAVLRADSGQVQEALSVVAQGTTRNAYAQAADLTSKLLRGLATEVITTLERENENLSRTLQAEYHSQAGEAASASIYSTQVQNWPVGSGVPQHFLPAANEILLQDVNGYPAVFAVHVAQMTKQHSAEAAEAAAVREIITFGRATPQGLFVGLDGLRAFTPTGSPIHVARKTNWRPAYLGLGAEIQSAVSYDLRLGHVQLLEAAREWAGRDDFDIKMYVKEGIQSFLQPAHGGIGSAELSDRANLFSVKFAEALTLAAPLVGVDQGLIDHVHGQDQDGLPAFGIRYSFSKLPLISDNNPIVERLKDALAGDPHSYANQQRLVKALDGNGGDRSQIDIISTYHVPYLPMAFNSLTTPIRDAWAASNDNRSAFWTYRRARPLREFVPVSPTWQKAFYGGWLIGRMTGLIQTEVLPTGVTQVRVWDAVNRDWAAFDTDLLGVVKLGSKSSIPGTNEGGWNIPAAIMESLALAIAKCEKGSIEPLRPYTAVKRLGATLYTLGFSQSETSPLSEWVANGVVAGVAPSQLRALSPDGLDRSAVDPREARLEAADDWLEKLATGLRSKFLAQGELGAPGTGVFSTIDQHNFWAIEREYEIAPELTIAADSIREELVALRRRAALATSAGFADDDLPDA